MKIPHTLRGLSKKSIVMFRDQKMGKETHKKRKFADLQVCIWDFLATIMFSVLFLQDGGKGILMNYS